MSAFALRESVASEFRYRDDAFILLNCCLRLLSTLLYQITYMPMFFQGLLSTKAYNSPSRSHGTTYSPLNGQWSEQIYPAQVVRSRMLSSTTSTECHIVQQLFVSSSPLLRSKSSRDTPLAGRTGLWHVSCRSLAAMPHQNTSMIFWLSLLKRPAMLICLAKVSELLYFLCWQDGL